MSSIASLHYMYLLIGSLSSQASTSPKEKEKRLLPHFPESPNRTRTNILSQVKKTKTKTKTMDAEPMQSAGAKSAVSRDMQELTQGRETVSRQVQGHKANLSNPNTSEKSKEHSREVIEELGGDGAHYGGEENPRSKQAAEGIDGSRAMLH
ncbi:hypothetical protein F5Y17DRAFT_411900 [Xylariaceae sp. FL0594]|nr:hypothetical protein F5Y17DRAFT_411900 [Xylariaceae sp. FL0594]